MALINQYKILKSSGSLSAFYDNVVYWDIAKEANKFFVTFERGLYAIPNNKQESIGTMEINYPKVSNAAEGTNPEAFLNGITRNVASYDAFLQEIEESNGPESHNYDGFIPITELRGTRYFQTTITSSVHVNNTYTYEIKSDEAGGTFTTTRSVSASYFYPFSSHQLSVLRKSPTLVLDLDAPSELPNDVGTKGFVLIPEQTHQRIKDNLEYYLEKAGLLDKTTKTKTPKRGK